VKRREFFKITFLMFLPFSIIFFKNNGKRNNIKSYKEKSAPKANRDYYLYL